MRLTEEKAAEGSDDGDDDDDDDDDDGDDYDEIGKKLEIVSQTNRIGTFGVWRAARMII